MGLPKNKYMVDLQKSALLLFIGQKANLVTEIGFSHLAKLTKSQVSQKTLELRKQGGLFIGLSFGPPVLNWKGHMYKLRELAQPLLCGRFYPRAARICRKGNFHHGDTTQRKLRTRPGLGKDHDLKIKM